MHPAFLNAVVEVFRQRKPTRGSATAASAESQPEVKPQRKRREMTAAEKKAVSERMTTYWAERRKKAPKKAPKK